MRFASLVLFVGFLTGCATSPTFDPVTMDPPPADPPTTNVELTLSSHGKRLPAYLMLAGGPGPHPTALLLHGYPGNEKNLDLAQSLRRAGWNVLFMHYRGAWGAEGTFRIGQLHEDALSALNFLRAHAGDYRVDPQRLVVIGHSMGGFATIRTAASDDRVRCAVGLAAANLGGYADRDAARQAGFARYSDGLFMLNGWDGETALEELKARQAEWDLGRLGPDLVGRPVLLITGTEDTAVPVQVQRDLVEAWASSAEGPSVTTIEMSGDHSFSAERIELQRRVLSWLNDTCLEGGSS